MTEIAYAAIGAAFVLGIILGAGVALFVARKSIMKSVAPQELSELMGRIVNQEGAELRRKEMHRMLHDAGRRTMRLDGGSPAKVHQMRRRRRKLRHTED